jgi:ABC-2 type transport system permease protein
MGKLVQRIFNERIRALVRKEFVQILRDKRLAMSLTMQPVVQLLLIGLALSATVSDLRLGIVDNDRTPESRALLTAMTESKSFRLAHSYFSTSQLGSALGRGDLDLGIVVPYDYTRSLQRGHVATVQLLLNAVDANTATISQGYAESVLESYNRDLARSGLHATFQQIATPDVNHRGQITLRPAFLYNPGLEGSWFIVTGVFGLLLLLNGSLVAATIMIKEREGGTVEQLLMSPASTSEIILAKIAPVFFLMCLVVLLILALLKIVFHVPFHGSMLLILGGAALCILSAIGIGTVTATFSKTAQQALLTGFFINPPLVSLSGALTPVEAMPHWLQPLTVVNPMTHFVDIVRGVMLKGSGIATLWPHFLGLLALTLILVSLSVWRFRNQLS